MKGFPLVLRPKIDDLMSWLQNAPVSFRLFFFSERLTQVMVAFERPGNKSSKAGALLVPALLSNVTEDFSV